MRKVDYFVTPLGFHNNQGEDAPKETPISKVKSYTNKEMINDVIWYLIGMSLLVGCIVTVLGWAYAIGGLGLLLMSTSKKSMKKYRE